MLLDMSELTVIVRAGSYDEILSTRDNKFAAFVLHAYYTNTTPEEIETSRIKELEDEVKSKTDSYSYWVSKSQEHEKKAKETQKAYDELYEKFKTLTEKVNSLLPD